MPEPRGARSIIENATASESPTHQPAWGRARIGMARILPESPWNGYFSASENDIRPPISANAS